MTSVWQRVQSYCASILSQRPDEGRPAESPLAPSAERRRDRRMAQGETCDVALTHAFGPDHIMIEEGSGMAVNMSRSGMQVLLGVRPRPGQLLEVHLGGTLQRSVSLMEVRWAKPVREDAQGQLYVAGCRLTFGPTRYWAF